MPNRGPGPMFFTHNGQTKTLRQWAEELGISYFTLYSRIRTHRIPPERALDPNFKRIPGMPKRYTHAGRTLTLRQWANELGVRYATLSYRLTRGLPLEQALTPKKLKVRRDTKRYTVNGITKTLPEWAEHIGITYSALAQRLTRHTLAEAIAIPPRRVARPNGGPGVPSNLEGCEGTGAGGFPQVIPNKTFSKKDEV